MHLKEKKVKVTLHLRLVKKMSLTKLTINALIMTNEKEIFRFRYIATYDSKIVS